MNITPRRAAYVALLVATACGPLPAQTASPAPMKEEVLQLDKISVNRVPLEQRIMPTERPFNSVFGVNMSVLDTPRNVTIISREQLNAIGVLETRDFSKLTASSYTQTNFGLPSNPAIRGLTADVLVNGMRRGLTINGNGMPINFNALESVNIVKGTANVIYGASNYSGGYADFITKRPYFDGFRGFASATMGSFDVYRWTTDLGGPISDKLAYRLSYSGEDSKGYYYNGKKKTQAFYAAAEWRPTDHYTLEVNGEFFVADVTENWGINRVTQTLIDDGLYMADTLTDAQYAAFIATLQGSANLVQPGKLVPVDRRRRLLAPGDDSFGINITTQIIQTLKLSDDSKIVNNTFFNYVDRDTFSSYYYNSVHKDNYGLENRLQYEGAFELGATKHSYAAGFTLRHQKVWGVDDFWHEPVNSFDLTRDPNLNRVPASAFVGFNPGILIPGYGPRGVLPGRYGSPGATYGGFPYVYDDLSSNDSRADQVSPFYQHRVSLNDRLSLLVGGRVDYLHVENTDPLPPPGFKAASDSISVEMPSFNASAVYKPTERVSTYYTFGYTTTAAPGLGGGYVFTGLAFGGDGRHFTEAFFDQKNFLHEIGLKVSMLDAKLFLGAALYDQHKKWRTDDGKNRYTQSKGFEIEANYQPNSKVYATASYSYFDSVQRFTGFLADSIVYDQRLKSSIPLTPDFPVINAEFKQPGMPEHLFNFLVTYKFTTGFGVSLGTVVTGPMVTSQEGAGFGLFGSVPVVFTANRIPWQHSTDLILNYDTKKWGTRLALRNLTDQKNWSAPNPGYGNGSINAELPFNMELTVTTKF
jgi:outer membrane receptor for monomeric catechols